MIHDLYLYLTTKGDQYEEETQQQIKIELSKDFENIKETKLESNLLKAYRSNGIFSKDQNSTYIKELTSTNKLLLPNFKI